MIPKIHIPFEGEHLWDWYWNDLCKYGESKLSFYEIKSWVELYDLTVYAWEIKTLLKMDSAFYDILDLLKQRDKK